MNNNFLAAYAPIVFFVALAMGLSLVPIFLSWLRARRNPYPEKISPYECGFEPFQDARGRFDVRFYLVAILFIVFDLEIAFLFPWAAAFQALSPLAFWSMMLFLSVLGLGFVYEWRKGALDWS